MGICTVAALGIIDDGTMGGALRYPGGSHVIASRYLLFDLNGTLAVGHYPNWNRIYLQLDVILHLQKVSSLLHRRGVDAPVEEVIEIRHARSPSSRQESH